jgi:hypothetical protein
MTEPDASRRAVSGSCLSLCVSLAGQLGASGASYTTSQVFSRRLNRHCCHALQETRIQNSCGPRRRCARRLGPTPLNRSGLYRCVDHHGMPVVIPNTMEHVSLVRDENSKEVTREEPHRILTTHYCMTSGPKNPSRGHGHKPDRLSENPYRASNTRVSFPSCKERHSTSSLN